MEMVMSTTVRRLYGAPDRRFENHFKESHLGRKPPLQDTIIKIIKCESEPKFGAFTSSEQVALNLSGGCG
jgi:hypothetical protein